MAYKKNPNRKKLPVIIAGALLFVGIGTVTILELTNQTYLFHERKAVPGIIPSKPLGSQTTGSDDKDGAVPSTGNTDSPETPKEGDDNASQSPSGAAPLNPSGNFISNHSPNLDGNPAPSSVESVCNTTPGAKCHIEFTNTEGVTKSLAPQTTDSSGATYWSWDVNQAGLTTGAWKIKVVATLNGKTSSTNDIQDLVVGP